MTKLEHKKIAVELLQVQAAKASLELRIEERLDEIKRLEENIAISAAKEEELKEKLNQSKKE
jgi:hypothetical protein